MLPKKRPSAGRGIFACGVHHERRTADGCVEVAVSEAWERINTERRVVYTGGYAGKGEFPICRVAYGNRAWIWCVCGALHLLAKSKADEGLATTSPVCREQNMRVAMTKSE